MSWRASAAARFSHRPRTRLSRTRISLTPSSIRQSTMCEPIRPAPPVTRTVEPAREFFTLYHLGEEMIRSHHAPLCSHLRGQGMQLSAAKLCNRANSVLLGCRFLGSLQPHMEPGRGSDAAPTHERCPLPWPGTAPLLRPGSSRD